jgi:hypothetical protein
MWVAYDLVRQTSSRVCAATVAAVLVSRPQKLCAPWRASSIRSVISLKVVSIRLRHSAMTLRRAEGHGPALVLIWGDQDGGAAGGLLAAKAAAESFVGEQVTRSGPGFEQVCGGLALGDCGGTMAQARMIRLPRSVSRRAGSRRTTVNGRRRGRTGRSGRCRARPSRRCRGPGRGA